MEPSVFGETVKHNDQEDRFYLLVRHLGRECRSSGRCQANATSATDAMRNVHHSSGSLSSWLERGAASFVLAQCMIMLGLRSNYGTALFEVCTLGDSLAQHWMQDDATDLQVA